MVCTTTKYCTALSGVSHFHTEEQERRFFHALCYAVGAEKALLQAAFRARI